MNATNIRDRVWNSGVASIAIASAVYSIAAALVRPLDPAIPVLEIVSVRSALSLSFSGLAYVASNQSGPFFGAVQNIPLLALRGLVGAAAMDCFYAAIQRLPLGDAVSIMFLNPAITAVMAWILLREALGWQGACGVCSSLLGMLLVVQPPFLYSRGDGAMDESQAAGSPASSWNAQRAVGTVFGIGSAFLAAGAYLAIRLIGKKETPLTVAVWFHTSAVTHSALLLAVGWPRPAVWPRLIDWACLLGIAMSSFTANILLNRGFQLDKAAVASAVNYTQVIYSHFIGDIIFREQTNAIGVAGAALIAVGVVAVAVDSKRKTVENDSVVGNGGELPLQSTTRDEYFNESDIKIESAGETTKLLGDTASRSRDIL